ncbi:MAG: DUF5777 family beta-barrel protein [Gemmatimonadota bacterium]|nr:DUF5777 family beta-barrel protein [Gemmatimonadota bacterium]
MKAWLGLCIPRLCIPGLRILVLSIPIPCLTAPSAASAQTVFASTQSATLPTAAPSDAGDILVEISHRFGYLSDGASDLWGLDGFVLNRLGLAYAPHDHLTVGILRSNSLDNTEFNARFAGLGFDAPTGPVEFAAQAGIAWNLQVDTAGGHDGHQHVVLHGGNAGTGDNAGTANRSRDETAEANEMQAYAQVIANAMVAGRLALGVVPTFLWNPRIEDADPVSTVSVGVNGQLYLDRTWSVFGEWIFSQPRQDQEYDSGSFGVEIRTRGHFFKLLVTNQHQMNPMQTLAGAAEDFLDPGSWRIGFNIQRRLRF